MNDSISGDTIADALAAPDPARVIAALGRLAAGATMSAASMEALVRCLGAENKTIRLRAADTFAAIARSDARAAMRLRAALRDDNPRTRFSASYALGALGDDTLGLESADALLETLGDNDGDLRWAAAALIVRLGRPFPREIGARLMDCARGGDSVAQAMALYAMRDLELQGQDVLDVAWSASRAKEVRVRHAALALVPVLREHGERASDIAVERLQSDPDAGVRRGAAATLGRAGVRSPRVTRALERARDDANDASLARAGRDALARLNRE